MNQQDENQETQHYWDRQAATFDNEPDHGLRDPVVRAAWAELLRERLPLQNADILDLGCGTGSLSLLLAELGQRVTGIDFSAEMIALARDKAARAGLAVQFQVMDAAVSRFPARSFDALVCRHVLWALPEPGQVLARWAELLRPDGILLLVEGFWHTGGGLRARDVLPMLPPTLADASILNLSDRPALWGGAVSDERYALNARRVMLQA